MFSARNTGAAVVLWAALTAAAGAHPAPAPKQPPAPKPADDTRVVTTEPIHALVLPMKGSYSQHQAAFERLAGFLAGRGAAPAGAPFARYFSDPSKGEADLLWEVGFPVATGVAAEAPFEVKDLPATLAAVHVHRGPYEQLATAWPVLVQWVISNGYQPAGSPVQVFQGDPSAPAVEMRLPVQK